MPGTSLNPMRHRSASVALFCFAGRVCSPLRSPVFVGGHAGYLNSLFSIFAGLTVRKDTFHGLLFLMVIADK
jgi:hypothetical protein